MSAIYRSISSYLSNSHQRKMQISVRNTSSVLELREKIGKGGRSANRLIEGDNLDALAILGDDPAVRGKVRLIYIDPPFATNQTFKAGLGRTSTMSSGLNDPLAYEDKIVGGAYLDFLRKRLMLMRDLLAEDGSLYLHIDTKIGHYVKIVLDEVFGFENFVNEITRVKCNPKNFARKGFGNIKDTIFFYSKSKKFLWNDSREEFTPDDLDRLFPKVDKKGRRYTTTPLHAPGETVDGATGKPWRGLKPPPGRHWRNSPRELDSLDKRGLIEWSNSGNPRKIIYADEFVKKGKKRQDVWEFKDSFYPEYPTEKNMDMLKEIIKTSSNRGDIVLDCFCGSGSTLLAAESTGRQWIGIDQSPTAIGITLKRLKETGSKFHFFQCK